MATEGIRIKITHLQRVLPSPPYSPGTTRNTSLLLSDLNYSNRMPGIAAEPCYIPSGETIYRTYTSDVARSYEEGELRTLIEQGEISTEFEFGDGAQQGADGTVFVISTAGAPSPDVYTAEANEFTFMVDTTNDAVNIQLLAGSEGLIRVIDIGNNATVNNITVLPAAGETIDGGASYVLDTSSTSAEFVWHTGGAGWDKVAATAVAAAAIPYDNAVSGLAATNTQAAIDEVVAGGGGGGASVIEVVTPTGVIADSGGTADLNIDVGTSDYLIAYIDIEKTAGTGIHVTMELHSTDAFSDVPGLALFAQAGFDITSKVYGPEIELMGTSYKMAIPFHDADNSGEIHLRVTNTDGANTISATVTVRVIDTSSP